MSNMKVTLHIIPIGGKEPIHHANSRCWCNPFEGDSVTTHRANDGRERLERQGIIQEGNAWATVAETWTAAEPVRRTAPLRLEEVEETYGKPLSLVIYKADTKCHGCERPATGRSSALVHGQVIDYPSCDDCNRQQDTGTYDHIPTIRRGAPMVCPSCKALMVLGANEYFCDSPTCAGKGAQ